jgi:hypothetical protein
MLGFLKNRLVQALLAVAIIIPSYNWAMAAEEPDYTALRTACTEVAPDDRGECSYLVAKLETAWYEIKFSRKVLLVAAAMRDGDVTNSSIEDITDRFVVVDKATASLRQNFPDVWAAAQ